MLSRLVDSDSIDCVAFLNEENFISGANDGSLAIWNMSKKKPIASYPRAHRSTAGIDDQDGEEEEEEGESIEATKRKILNSLQSTNNACNWVCSVAALTNTDLLASGSDDGFIRFWAYSAASQQLTERFKIPIVSVRLH